MDQDSFEVEQLDQSQITVRHRRDGHRWIFTINVDPVSGRPMITSGRSGRDGAPDDSPARVVTEALRFARAVARNSGLID